MDVMREGGAYLEGVVVGQFALNQVKIGSIQRSNLFLGLYYIANHANDCIRAMAGQVLEELELDKVRYLKVT